MIQLTDHPLMKDGKLNYLKEMCTFNMWECLPQFEGCCHELDFLKCIYILADMWLFVSCHVIAIAYIEKKVDVGSDFFGFWHCFAIILYSK